MDYSILWEEIELDGNEAVQVILKSISHGQRLNNPKKGISIIYELNQDHIVYIRGKSKIKINTDDIADVIDLFKGKKCSSLDLREWRPNIFNSNCNGHSCHCTFLFMLLKNAGLIEGDIQGEGKSGSAFFVQLKN